ncbi:MAG: hypothetical protein K6F45_04395 [Saccharofermentans sp.]|nr:hypothetical protein [Saccharofermentans sp.]
MHRHIRPDIDYAKCNAYSAVAHMYAAIDHNGVPDDKRGGIVVFEEGVKEVAGLPDIKASWCLGHFFKGRYTGQEGLVYSEGSWCVEIIGISDDALIAIGEELCRENSKVPVLIKVYSERNNILLVDCD